MTLMTPTNGCRVERPGGVKPSPNQAEPNAVERGGERGLRFDNGVALEGAGAAVTR